MRGQARVHGTDHHTLAHITSASYGCELSPGPCGYDHYGSLPLAWALLRSAHYESEATDKRY